MARQDPPLLTLGQIIRKQREMAAVPMRQLAEAVGISNPYLSQIERGLRAPSDAVLKAIAESLQTTADQLYTEAGYVEPEQGGDAGGESPVEAAVGAAQELTQAQRSALLEIYQAFVDANAVRRRRGRDAG